MHDLPVTTRVLWWVWCLIPLELAKHSVCFWLRLGAWMSKTSWPQSGAAVIEDPPYLINHSIRWEVVKSKTGFKTSGFDWKRVVFFAPYELCGFGWLGRGSTLIAKYYFGGEPPLIDQPGSISGVYRRYLFIRILYTYSIFCNIVHIHIVLFLSIQRSTWVPKPHESVALCLPLRQWMLQSISVWSVDSILLKSSQIQMCHGYIKHCTGDTIWSSIPWWESW